MLIDKIVSKTELAVFGKMIGLLIKDPKLRKVTKYLDKNLVLTATAKTYSNERDKKRRDYKVSRHDIVLKIGRPNYIERQFIKQCITAELIFPIKKLQLKFM